MAADAPHSELRRALLNAMRQEFGEDQRRIRHAERVLADAEAIMKEEGGDGAVIIAAAILHDIGIQEAERKHGSNSGTYQELEGPPIARRILNAATGLLPQKIDHICAIVGSHHTPDGVDSLEWRILWDADWLVNLSDERSTYRTDAFHRTCQTVFRTPSGHARGAKLCAELA